MGIFTRPESTTIEPPAADARGLEVPDDLAAEYPAALAYVQQRFTVTDANWQHSARTVAHHIATQRMLDRHGLTVVPGSVNKPTPPAIVPGSSTPPWAVAGYASEAEAEEHRRRWAESENAVRRLGNQFDRDVEAEQHRILSQEPQLLIEHYQHGEALKRARKVHDRTRLSEQRHSRVRATRTCPECGRCDPPQVGDVTTRHLVPGATVQPFTAQPTLRSCLACWDLASALYVAKLANATDPDNPHRTVYERLATLVAAQP